MKIPPMIKRTPPKAARKSKITSTQPSTTADAGAKSANIANTAAKKPIEPTQLVIIAITPAIIANNPEIL